MREWIVDLKSFVVEAKTKEEARVKAIKMIANGIERAIIDNIVEG